MENISFNTLEDLQKSVDNFYKVPVRSRFVIANKIHSRLKELNGFVKVFKENPILNYPSERFIIGDSISENEYTKYTHLLDEDVESFNFTIYSDIELSLDNLTGLYDIIRFCREQNNKADNIYLEKFPSHKDLIDVFKMAVSKINMFFSGSSPEIFKSSLDDIEFIISTNILTDSHVRRLLLAPIRLIDLPVFKSFFKEHNDLYKRLVAIFNTQISLVKQRRDEFILMKPFNDEALKAYLKIQKMGYEEMLIGMEYNGDYDISNRMFSIDINKALKVDEYVRVDYPHLKRINMIDKFKLESHGLKPILNKVYKGKDYYVHYKKGAQYLIYKNNDKQDVYFMIAKFPDGKYKSYKVTINDSNTFMDKLTLNSILESTFVVDYKKMNR